MSDRDKREADFLMSIPSFTLMSGHHRSISQSRYAKIYIKFKASPGSDDYLAATKKFVADAKLSLNSTEAN